MVKDVRVVRNQKAGEKVRENLEKRGFAAYYCATAEEALQQALALIPEGSTVSWGGCTSAEEIGLLDAVMKRNLPRRNSIPLCAYLFSYCCKRQRCSVFGIIASAILHGTEVGTRR